ncbi:TonB-dependent receptor plug domain protein [Ostertagia ostertagi]
MKSRLFCKTATALAVSVLATGLVYAQEAAKEEAAPRAKDDTVRLGTISVVGSSAKLGTGMMLNDDSVKGRSTITKAAMEKELGTGNVLQSIAQLPGVNTYNYDSTGLFGGDVSIRGFGSDQIGFTVNGVPVNDSGGYAFYAQEMIDKENVCTASVAQGSPELESPNSGATGGSVSMVTCDPSDTRRARFTQTLGGLNLNRTFVRVDSGRFMNNMAKVFLSYSHAEVDKWKGVGKAKKDHIDAGFSLDLNEDNKILGSILYNRMVNQNIWSVSKAQIAANGYGFDYASTFTPLKTPAGGTAQTDVVQSPLYYGMALNPFKNVIASVSGSFKLAENTYLKVQPYMWYGFGNGGWSQMILDETGATAVSSSSGSSLLGGAVDINGDGDKLDKVAVGRASVTKTNRPGVTAELSTTLGNHYLKAGLWFERAQHIQTQPAVRINADGIPADIWLQDGCIKRADGSCYEGRNTKTISTVTQVYLNDQVTLLNDRAFINFGLKLPSVTRDVTNYRNESGNLSYTVNPTTGALVAARGRPRARACPGTPSAPGWRPAFPGRPGSAASAPCVRRSFVVLAPVFPDRLLADGRDGLLPARGDGGVDAGDVGVDLHAAARHVGVGDELGLAGLQFLAGAFLHEGEVVGVHAHAHVAGRELQRLDGVMRDARDQLGVLGATFAIAASANSPGSASGAVPPSRRPLRPAISRQMGGHRTAPDVFLRPPSHGQTTGDTLDPVQESAAHADARQPPAAALAARPAGVRVWPAAVRAAAGFATGGCQHLAGGGTGHRLACADPFDAPGAARRAADRAGAGAAAIHAAGRLDRDDACHLAPAADRERVLRSLRVQSAVPLRPPRRRPAA